VTAGITQYEDTRQLATPEAQHFRYLLSVHFKSPITHSSTQWSKRLSGMRSQNS